MAMTLNDLFLGFRVHLVSNDDGALLYFGVQKGMPNERYAELRMNSE